MKKNIKQIICCLSIAVVAFLLVSFSCTGKKDRGSANTAFAQTNSSAINVNQNALSVIESLQEVNRQVSREVLPSVVELDIIETKKRSKNVFGDLPFYFFGIPQNENNQEEYKEKGLGSGVIIRKKGKVYYVLTNNHVAGTATEISVKLNDGRVFQGKLVGADKRMDIALVSFESDSKEIPIASLGDSDKVNVGDICYAMGAPLGYRQSVTQGIVSATGRSGDGIGNINDFIQTDAAINQGNSGGPLLNIYGQVIGINTWIASSSGGSIGLGFVIPINNVKRAIDEFITDGKITYGWMGVSLIEISDEYKKSLEVEGKEGAFVSQVFVNSPALKGGIQAGDFIIEINSNPVKSVDQLVRDVAVLKVNEKATFKVIRGGKELSFVVTIEERTEKVSSDDSKLWPGFIAVPLTDEVRKQFKVEEKIEGIAVANIIAKTPASALRLQEGDVITAVNGKKVKNLSEFYNAIDLSKNNSIQFDIYNEAGTITTGSWKLK